MTKNDNILKNITALNVFRPKSVFSGENSYTTLFMLPMYEVYMDSTRYKHFINGYVDDVGLRHCFKRPLFILIKYEAHTESLLEITNYLMSKKSFVYSYLAGTEGNSLLKMFVFECPNQFRTDYDHFLKGKYSKFSAHLQQKFNQFIKSIDGSAMESPLFGAIHKTSTFKKTVEKILDERLSPNQEYFGELKNEFEIFRYE